MTLFNETSLFDEGRQFFRDFNLAKADLKLWAQFFRKSLSDKYFLLLRDQIPWKQRVRMIYGKELPDPRLTAYYGGADGLN